MIYLYLILSAVLIPVLDNFFKILQQDYSWWLVPCLFLAFFVAMVIIQALVFIISFSLVNLNSPADRFAKFYRFQVKQAIPIILKLARVRIHSKGVEKVPQGEKIFFICNHQHDFDPLILLAAFPESDLGFIGKKEIYKTMPLIARIMHKIYGLPIDRENDRAAAKTIIEAARRIKDKKASMAVFPEGYTSPSCQLLPFRNGALKVAYRAQCPIAVCVLNNTRELPKRIFRRVTDIDLRVLKVVPYEEFKDLTTTELGDSLHGEMKAVLAELRKEN